MTKKYVNDATGCSATIERIAEGKWQLVATNAEGKHSLMVYGSQEDAFRAMIEFNNGWREADKDPEPRTRSELQLRAETAAARMLERTGHRILEMDWGCPSGEADIIAERNAELVFVDILARKGRNAGFPLTAESKKARREAFENIAMDYLATHLIAESVVRFDVVTVSVLDDDRCFIQHHIGAYSSD